MSVSPDACYATLFGKPRFWYDGREITGLSAIPLRMLAYLILAKDKEMPRHNLVNAIWPGHPVSEKSRDVRQAVLTINKSFEPLRIVTNEGGITMVKSDLVMSDVRLFERILDVDYKRAQTADQRVRCLLKSISLHTPNGLLPDAKYEFAGIQNYRVYLRQRYWTAMADLADLYVSGHQYDQAIYWTQKILAYPEDMVQSEFLACEKACKILIRTYFASGKPAEVKTLYRKFNLGTKKDWMSSDGELNDLAEQLNQSKFVRWERPDRELEVELSTELPDALILLTQSAMVSPSSDSGKGIFEHFRVPPHDLFSTAGNETYKPKTTDTHRNPGTEIIPDTKTESIDDRHENDGVSPTTSLPFSVRFVHSPHLPQIWADRSYELQDIADAFCDNPILVLKAITGVGKTSLVREYIDEARPPTYNFEGCMWFSFRYEKNVDKFFEEGCRYLIPGYDDDSFPKPFSKSVQLRDACKNRRILFVLDSLEEILESDQDTARFGIFRSDILREFLLEMCNQPSESRVLITCRYSVADLKVKGCKEIKLGDLSESSAVKYMLGQGIKGDEGEIVKVCRRWGYHAFTLTVLADYLAQPPSLGDIRGAEAFSQIPSETPQGEKLIEFLNGYYQGLNNVQKQLMARLCSFRFGISPATLEIIAVSEDGKACSTNDAGFHLALRRLTDAALLQIRQQQDGTIYDTHPLIKHYFYNRLTPAEKRNIHSILAGYAEKFPVPEELHKLQDLTPLIEQFYQYLGAERWQDAADLFRPGNPLGLYMYEWGHLEEQLEMLNLLLKSEHLPKPKTNDRRVNSLWSAAGLVNRKLGKLDEANRCLAKAVRIAHRQGDSKQEATHWTMRSYTYAYLGRYARALTMVNRGIELLRSSGHTIGPVQRGWKGAFLAALGDNDAGLIEMSEAIVLCQLQPIPNLRHECHTLIRRGDLFLIIGELDRSLEDYQRALVIGRTPGRRQADFCSDALRGLAEHSRMCSEYEPSFQYNSEALQIAKDTGNRYLEVQAYLAFARLMKAQGLLEDAVTFAEDALRLAKERKYRAEAAQAYLIQAQAALGSGMPHVARSRYQSAETIMKHVDHYETQRELAEIKVSLEARD